MKLDKNTFDPQDINPKYNMHADRYKPIPLKNFREHPDFSSTTKSTYQGIQVDGKSPASTLNSNLFQPDYAHNDNLVNLADPGAQVLWFLQGGCP